MPEWGSQLANNRGGEGDEGDEGKRHSWGVALSDRGGSLGGGGGWGGCSGGKRGQQRGRWPGVGGTFVMQDGRSGGSLGEGAKGLPPDKRCLVLACVLSVV